MNDFDSPNPEIPKIMYIDLNSAFATIEQQSRPLLRSRPVAILNRRTENTSLIAVSYEAKKMGIKVGMSYKEAKRLVPRLACIESDPEKYIYVYKKLKRILSDYSPNVVMKSIDEGLIDFHGVVNPRPLTEIGAEIKNRLKTEIGCAMTCNIGIAPNRFLAKLATELHKPDGMDEINADNLREVFGQVKLTDFCGIASRLERRLNSIGIYTPLEFLDADEVTLRRIVFKSIDGSKWYKRLRGYGVDDISSSSKTVGRQYVLENRNLSRRQIEIRLHNLCESVGARLRLQNKVARGVYVYVKTAHRKYWHKSLVCQVPFFSDKTINFIAQQLFKSAPSNVIEIGVHCYLLEGSGKDQLSLFCDKMASEKSLVWTIDGINRRFGERIIHSADTLEADAVIKQKISFGSTRYL